MTELAARIKELSPAAKRALLTQLLRKQTARGKVAPLSYAQQRLWFLDQLVSGNPFYNESSAIRLCSPLDTAALARALNEIVRRHEALRTVFEAADGQPLQRVLPPQPLQFPIIELGHIQETEREQEATRRVAEQARTPFDLVIGPLLRVALLRLAPADHIFVVTMHHIACDGWSTKVFFDELRVLYAAFSQGQPSPLPELAIQYRDFSLWQREWLQGTVMDEQLAYWRDRLAGLQTLELPADKRRPDVPTFAGGREPLFITAEVNAALESLCEERSVTPFMALLAAFQALLHRFTGQSDIAVGCPVANRNRPELEKLIGFFVNTLVMRTDFSGDPTFRDLLRRVREVALSAYAHQDLPFEKLVEDLQPERSASRNPLFQVTFQILSERANEEMSEQVRVLEVEQHTSKFDLRCDLWYRGEGLAGHIEYSSDLFEGETVKVMARHFETLVASMVADPDQTVSSAPLSEYEQQLLGQWNDTAHHPGPRLCVHERFEQATAANPGRLAIATDAQRITYGELNRRANQLAHHLKNLGIHPGSFVAVLLDRSVDLVVSILATLKTGAAYIPLDPSYPRERLSVMLREALVTVVLTKSEYAKAIPSFISQFRFDIDGDTVAKEDDTNLPKYIDEQSLAYVIFTSGSTGKPRGVEVLHASLNNLVDWHQREYQIKPEDRASVYASPGFDASVWEVWPYLSAGASLHIPDAESHASADRLAQWMAETSITIGFLPTPVAEAFVDLELPSPLSLRTLLTGGDKLRHYPRRALPFRFVNHYGPTENTVVATACAVRTCSLSGAPPIGKPISNVQVMVLDSERRQVPIGVKGELHLGGAGLARGYLNQRQLTKEKFISNPFDRRAGSRLYRTGDLVRYSSDGNLEFHGRVDDQIKIRGYRVEPGEIESALDQFPGVDKSLVVAHESDQGERTLTAYVVPKESASATDPVVAENLQSERVDEWQQIYEQVYGANQEERDRSFDIVGWNSSYTDLPIPRVEMEEQVTATVSRIAALGARNILEIGCGTGLLLLRLAGDCQRYTGTDFSKTALVEVENLVRERLWSQVDLHQRHADEFCEQDANSFDLVILNSVVQYFPHMNYLVKVIEGACRMLRPGGLIFVGDVRSRPLLRLLYSGIEIARAKDCTVGEVRARMARRLRAEPELIIDPQFFRALADRVDGISGVSIEVKRGWHRSELTGFRYDVLLEAARSTPVDTEDRGLSWEERPWESFGAVQALQEYLESAAPSALKIKGVPSARLWSERLKLQRLNLADDGELVSSLGLADIPEMTANHGVEPEGLWALEAELPYRIQVDWAEKGDYDVKCVRRSLLSTPWIFTRKAGLEPGERGKSWSSYGNEVLRRPSENYQTQALRQHARQWLPEYMVPSRFVWVPELPLTAHGKLNRAALSDLNGTRSSSAAAHERPTNEVESRLADIWQEVLGLESVSVHDNFFDLGGHSLLLVRLHSKLRQLFDTSISIIDLFRLSSINSLARALIAEGNHLNIRDLPSGRREAF